MIARCLGHAAAITHCRSPHILWLAPPPPPGHSHAAYVWTAAGCLALGSLLALARRALVAHGRHR